MEKLFGIPISQVTLSLVVVFALGVVLMMVVGLRNRVMFKMAVRNIPRRRAQSTLIVVGLMLATLLFSASFATGDTLAHSIRVEVLSQVGHVDERIQSDLRDNSGRHSMFSEGVFDEVTSALTDAPVDGVMPVVTWSVPTVSLSTRQTEPTLEALGLRGDLISAFDPLIDSLTGRDLEIESLRDRQIYLSADAAKNMRVGPGDQLDMFFGETPTRVEIAGVYVSGGNLSDSASATFRLAELQAILGVTGEINRIFVSNTGGLVAGAKHTDVVMPLLENLFEGRAFDADDVKRSLLDVADLVGAAFTSIFLLFGNFSIMAGILLIFLIFVMLAAERKRELGIARAVGAQRDHVVRLFTFEGAIYSLVAAGIGSLLGVGIGFVMVRVLASLFATFELDIVFAFRWQSVIISYTLGMAVTFLIVLIAAGTVSGLNIVRAIRDIPEPPGQQPEIRTRAKDVIRVFGAGWTRISNTRLFLAPVAAVTAFLILLLRSLPLANLRLIWALLRAGYLVIIIGILLIVTGINGERGANFLLGVSFVAIGASLVLLHLRRLGTRAAYSVSGLCVVLLWIVPWDYSAIGLPKMQTGIEMFILSGFMLVLGSVWVVMFNSAPLVRAVTSLLGRGAMLAPIMRTSMAYPMASRFRTGMTLAMFSLIVFTLMVLSTIIASFEAATEDTRVFSGGFDVSVRVNPTNPISDFKVTLGSVVGLDASEVEAVGGQSRLPVKLQQVGYEGDDLSDGFIVSVDEGYMDTISYGFSLIHSNYPDASSVWQALRDEPGTAVVSSFIVPARSEFGFGEISNQFRLQGFFRDDAVMPEVFVEAYDYAQKKMVTLRVIAVVEESVFADQSQSLVGPVMTSYNTLSQIQSLPLFGYFIRLTDPSRAADTAISLEDAFVDHGLRAESFEEMVREAFAINFGFNQLIRGFMSLGLIVGVAALGVIAARSVVERRSLIGMLRAIGYQRNMVQMSFLIESSFISLLGIAIGMILALGLSVGIVNEIGKDVEGIRYQVPWEAGLLVFVLAYGASLLTTFLPARQAAGIYPAEVLRLAE